MYLVNSYNIKRRPIIVCTSLYVHCVYVCMYYYLGLLVNVSRPICNYLYCTYVCVLCMCTYYQYLKLIRDTSLYSLHV